jgi:hypothetical protein
MAAPSSSGDDGGAALLDALLSVAATLVAHAQRASSAADADAAAAASPAWAAAPSAAAAAADEGEGAAEAARLETLLDCVGKPGIRARPAQLEALARVLPFLTRGRRALRDRLTRRFLALLDFQSLQEAAHDGAPGAGAARRAAGGAAPDEAEGEAYVKCFVCVVQRLGPDEVRALLALSTPPKRKRQGCMMSAFLLNLSNPVESL